MSKKSAASANGIWGAKINTHIHRAGGGPHPFTHMRFRRESLNVGGDGDPFPPNVFADRYVIIPRLVRSRGGIDLFGRSVAFCCAPKRHTSNIAWNLNSRGKTMALSPIPATGVRFLKVSIRDLTMDIYSGGRGDAKSHDQEPPNENRQERDAVSLDSLTIKRDVSMGG